MKIVLIALIAILIYYSPDARKVTSNILRKTADVVDSYHYTPPSFGD